MLERMDEPGRAAAAPEDHAQQPLDAVVAERQIEFGVVCRSTHIGARRGGRQVDGDRPRPARARPSRRPRRARCHNTRAPAQRRAEQIHHQEGRDHQIGFEHLDVEAKPDQYRRQQQPAQAAARSTARVMAGRAEQHGQHEQAVDRVVAVRDDADRGDGQKERGQQTGDPRQRRAAQMR